MEEEKKTIEEMHNNSVWNNSFDSIWIILIFMLCFCGWSTQDTKDYELRERVARLEGQMSMIGGR